MINTYEIITSFMSNPAIRQHPEFPRFEKAISQLVVNAEKETLLLPSEINHIDEQLCQYVCPSCGHSNAVTSEIYPQGYHYCKNCGRKAKNS